MLGITRRLRIRLLESLLLVRRLGLLWRYVLGLWRIRRVWLLYLLVTLLFNLWHFHLPENDR